MSPRAFGTLACALAVLGVAAAAGAQQLTRQPLSALIVEQTGGYIVVTADKAAVHAAPDPRAPVLEVLDDDEVVPIDGRQGDWYRVVVDETRRGWVAAGAAALFFYPQYLFSYRPPEDWVPPHPFWAPPSGWVPPPGWVRHPDGWRPPPRWRPKWWKTWFNRRDQRWEEHRREWEHGRGRDWGRHERDGDRERDRDRGRGRDRGRDWDGDRDRDRDRGRRDGFERR